jgi:PHD/YefM family antitoxin component YafN of YafNO toxin-antitoxin module
VDKYNAEMDQEEAAHRQSLADVMRRLDELSGRATDIDNV